MDQTNAEDFQKALYWSMFYLKYRLRTEKEMRDYLQKKRRFYTWTDDLIETVIQYLIDEDLLNDKKFIEIFVESRKSSKPKSQYVLTQELMRHGIAKELIDNYFQEQPLEEESQALKALQSRWSRFSDLSTKERFEKAVSFLLRRGFAFSLAKKTVAQLEESG